MERNADFCVEIQFEESSDPCRILGAASAYIEAIRGLDGMLVRSIHPDLTCSYRLMAVESGSMRSFIRAIVEQVDDEELKRGNIQALLGPFLIQAKKTILSYLKEHEGLGSRETLLELSNSVHMLALQAGMERASSYVRPSPVSIGQAACDISSAVQRLDNNAVVSFKTDGGTVSFSKAFNITPQDFESILVSREIITEGVKILKVRKPDFLGNSRWGFRYAKQNLSAEIKDPKWLVDFQNGKQDFRPGVSLEAKCQTAVRYGYDGEVIDERLSIEKVLAVVPPQEQLSLL